MNCIDQGRGTQVKQRQSLQLSRSSGLSATLQAKAREIGQAFAKILEPLLAQIRANIAPSLTLGTLRDKLLPNLLSGEISVEISTS